MKFTRTTVFLPLIFAVVSAQAQLYKLNDPNGTNAVLSTEETYTRIILGQDQPNNALEITAGGRANVGSLVDIGQQVGATNSSLTVNNGGLLVIGAADTNNLPSGGIVVGDSTGTGELKVGYGSSVETDNLIVGAGAGETGAVVARNGGKITVLEDLTIGTANNSGNTVTIEDESALIIADTLNLKINNITGATENLNELNINRGGSLLVQGDVNSTALSSSENVNFESGSTLGVGGTLTAKDNSINNGINILIDNALSTNHTAQWHADYMDIGTSSSDNSLIVRNGAIAVSTNDISIGTDSSAQNNALSIEGSNSTFTALDRILVGINGKNNEFNVLDGAKADIAADLALGASVSSGNRVRISGTNSMLSVGGNTYVGGSGGSNTLELEDGAAADFQGSVYVGEKSANNRFTLSDSTATIDGKLIIGNAESASGSTGSVSQNSTPNTSGNMASVGTNSTLNLKNGLVVGKEGSGSILNIYDGGSVDVTGDAVIGEASGDNYIYLQRDSNTQFNVTGDLVVGKSEEGSNRFAVYGGTADIGGDLLLGASTNQHEIKNFIHLETTNAALLVSGSLQIGASNSLNTLDVVDGATASASQLLIGAYAGTSNNTVTVSGENASIAISGMVQIGSTNSGGNSILLKNGGTLETAQDHILIGSTNDYLTVADGGILKTLGWDFDAQTNLATNIVFESGSTLHMMGSLYGTNMVEGGLHFLLDGTGSDWDTGTNTLYVGYETDNNTLSLTNGAKATTLTDLHIGFDSSDNIVNVGGSGSVLTVGNNLILGAEIEDWQRNYLNVLDGGQVNVGNDLFVYRGSEITIDPDSSVVIDGNYIQDEYSTLSIGVSSNQASSGNINLVVENDARFTSSYNSDNHDIIRVFDYGIGESNTVTIVKAGGLYLDDHKTTGSSIIGHIATNDLLGFTVNISNETDYAYIILSDFMQESIGGGGNLTGQLLDISSEIDAMADNGDTNAAAMIATIRANYSTEAEIQKVYGDLYDEKQSAVPAHNVINQGIQSVNNQLFMRADTTRARSGQASSAMNRSEGVAGPHQPEQELQGWISGFGSWADKSASDGFAGYNSSLSGFMIGADLSVAPNVLVGLAGGKGSADIDKDNGASADTKSIYAALYSSIGTDSWFGDFSLIYANSDVDAQLDHAIGTTADYNAQNIAFSIGGGKEMIGNYLILTPQASLLGNIYSQEAYKEDAPSAVGRNVDSYSAFYLQSAIGGSASFYMGMGNIIFKPEVRLHWLHEWLADDESLDFKLAGGANNYSMLLQAPEKDIFKLGIGSSAKIGEFLELRADLDTRFGKDYSDYTLLGSLRYQF
ncbi:autotransporter domain-containing protein [Pontiella agarivorans]|uniref:Autotransporter domain-containing protein n=1 Tax=Pontiella agarivorans TaxID=3038953 RepID=A0ABU5N013_9BACT|nr:autotransporter domain-containing protein [Pontiella agarivorans]MDZ8119783.1 autotransporter domain-containing protein [Pontiella agarivorans]